MMYEFLQMYRYSLLLVVSPWVAPDVPPVTVDVQFFVLLRNAPISLTTKDEHRNNVLRAIVVVMVRRRRQETER